jgi:hypothetical protein
MSEAPGSEWNHLGYLVRKIEILSFIKLFYISACFFACHILLDSMAPYSYRAAVASLNAGHPRVDLLSD